MSGEPRDLSRFLAAQETVFEEVVAELTDGRKRTHWMWFVFPQLRELGTSETAVWFGLRDLDEARAYLGHPILGGRLRRMVDLVLHHQDRSASEIFGAVDAVKFRSMATLFAAAAEGDADRRLFRRVLDVFYAGGEDVRTLDLLRREH